MFQGTAHFVADLPLQPNTLFAVPILADRVAMLQRVAAKGNSKNSIRKWEVAKRQTNTIWITTNESFTQLCIKNQTHWFSSSFPCTSTDFFQQHYGFSMFLLSTPFFSNGSRKNCFNPPKKFCFWTWFLPRLQKRHWCKWVPRSHRRGSDVVNMCEHIVSSTFHPFIPPFARLQEKDAKTHPRFLELRSFAWNSDKKIPSLAKPVWFLRVRFCLSFSFRRTFLHLGRRCQRSWWGP